MAEGRIFLVGRAALNYDELSIARPTTADKKMPDRTLSTDRRILREGRLPNLFAPRGGYLRPEYTKIEDIAKKIISLSRAYPGVDILINKETSATKLVRIHPDGVKLPPPHPTRRIPVQIPRTEFVSCRLLFSPSFWLVGITRVFCLHGFWNTEMA